MIKYMIIIAILSLILLNLWADKTQNDLDNYEIKKEGRVIKFIEKDTRNVMKTINIVDDNPYIQRGFKQKRGSEYGELDVTINELRDFPISSELMKQFEYIAKENGLSVRSNPAIFYSEDKKYIGINYGLGVAGLAEYESSYSTIYIKIYSAKGELIHFFELLDRYCGYPILSENAKYVGFKFGMEYDGTKGRKTGFAIYDLNRNSIVLEEYTKKGWLSAYPAAKNNLIQMEFHNSQSFEMIFIDFDLRKEYKITISESKRFRLKEITRKGLIFGKKNRKDKETEFLSFDKDFEVIEW